MRDPVVIAAWITSFGLVIGVILTGFVKVWLHLRDLHEQQKVTHDLVNSRMEELLALSRRFARELGIEEGIREEKRRKEEEDRAKL